MVVMQPCRENLLLFEGARGFVVFSAAPRQRLRAWMPRKHLRCAGRQHGFEEGLGRRCPRGRRL